MGYHPSPPRKAKTPGPIGLAPPTVAAGISGDPARRERLTDHLVTFARAEAERAMLELDALLIGPRRYRAARRSLIARRDAMLDDWLDAAAEKGQADCPCVAAAAEHAESAFRDRVRELRAAAAPGGHA